MKVLSYILLFLCCGLCEVAQAQSIGSAFRVGLNFPQFLGDSEKGANGEDLEEFSTFTGFHVAGGVVFKLLDHYGFKAEIMFTQKGSRYRYNGPSTYIFTTTTGSSYATAIGTRVISNRITNSYISLPVTGYMKYGKFELNAGASISFLVSSTGVGDFEFSGISALDNGDVLIQSLIDHNYRKDNLESTPELLSFQENFVKTITVDGQDFLLLNDETAYAQFTDIDGGVYGKLENRLTEKYYRSLDVALHAGVSYYISPGLYFGFTAEYGLRDVSNPYFEYSYSESTELERVERSDTDRNFLLMFSVGFSF